MAKDFLSFDTTLRRLCITEDQLKALVSHGYIRAYREGDQMKFKASEVEIMDEEGVPRVTVSVTTHGLVAGWPLCGFTSKVPRDWPSGHNWVPVSDLERITCPGCREATYVSNPTTPVPATA